MKKANTTSLLAIAAALVAVALYSYGMPAAYAGLFSRIDNTPAPPTLYPGASSDTFTATSNASTTDTQASVHTLANRNGPVANISRVPVQGGWINSLPLDLKPLQKQNKIVLIDFWAYTCINCIRANAFSEELWNRYKHHGLVVIGVHSLEFDVGSSPINILAAVKRQGLTYPILTDGHRLVWQAFHNRYWPAAYLIDPQGKIVFHHFGEGDYAHEEQVVRQQLQKAGYELPDYGPPNPQVKLIPARRAQTPELYAGPGFLRRPYGNSKQPQSGVTTDFKLPRGDLAHDRIYLAGSWHGDHDYVQSTSSGTIALNYRAQSAYVVLASDGKQRTVTVTLDGKPVPAAFRGKDLHLRNGQTVMTVDTPRLYWPINNHAPYGRHTIRLKVPTGVRLYSFTFGTYQ